MYINQCRVVSYRAPACFYRPSYSLSLSLVRSGCCLASVLSQSNYRSYPRYSIFTGAKENPRTCHALCHTIVVAVSGNTSQERGANSNESTLAFVFRLWLFITRHWRIINNPSLKTIYDSLTMPDDGGGVCSCNDGM